MVSPLIGQTYLVNEDFQTGIPVAFQNIQDDTSTVHPNVSEFTDAWIIKENPDSIGDSVIASTSYYQFGGAASRWLILPQMQLGAYGNFIQWQAKSHDPSFPDGYQVLVSTTNDSLHNFTDTLFFTDFELPNWSDREVQLADSTYSGQQIYVAFVHDSEDQFILYLDNIKIRTEDPLSVDDYSMENVSVIYPNPFHDILNIQSNREVAALYLRDVSGKIIQEKIGENYKMDKLNTLDQGVYFLSIQYKSGLFETRKVIKQ